MQLLLYVLLHNIRPQYAVRNTIHACCPCCCWLCVLLLLVLPFSQLLQSHCDSTIQSLCRCIDSRQEIRTICTVLPHPVLC
jgi:hypothetical protein